MRNAQHDRGLNRAAERVTKHARPTTSTTQQLVRRGHPRPPQRGGERVGRPTEPAVGLLARTRESPRTRVVARVDDLGARGRRRRARNHRRSLHRSILPRVMREKPWAHHCTRQESSRTFKKRYGENRMKTLVGPRTSLRIFTTTNSYYSVIKGHLSSVVRLSLSNPWAFHPTKRSSLLVVSVAETFLDTRGGYSLSSSRSLYYSRSFAMLFASARVFM